MYKVTVRLMSATSTFDRPYSYLSESRLEPGTVVALPFGNSNRNKFGVVIESDVFEGEEKLKSILFSLPEPYSLTHLQLETAQFMADRFFTTFGDCARLMLPTGLDIDTAEYLTKGESFARLEQCALF